MAYEKKVLDVLDKLVDSIIYEEGRLALINKYGPMLSDEDKVRATELITKQRASLDRLFQIYKSELDPVMLEISETSMAMEPLVEKLLFADKVARNVAAQVTTGENPFNNVEENNPIAMAAEYTETPAPVATEAPVVVETPAPVATEAPVVVETAAPVATEAPVVVETPAPVATEVPVVAETPAPVVTEAPATDLVIPAAGESEVHEAAADAIENAASGEGAANAVENAASALSGFVLSPIDEDVAPATVEEEKKAAEEEVKVAEAGVAAADQQLQAVDLMKTEIENDPNLTEEEKKESLEKYTKITEGAVRAILVTKVQFEKLLASRTAQKALLGGEEKKEETGEAVIPAIAVEGASDASVADVVTADTTATDGVVIPAIVGDTAASTDTPAEVTATEGDAVVSLPTIDNGGNVTPPGASGDAILPTIEIPGATAPATDANANELQTMIEQGNALYKEGKTDEAEAVFNQVSELNQEIQSTIPEVTEDAKVLVKE